MQEWPSLFAEIGDCSLRRAKDKDVFPVQHEVVGAVHPEVEGAGDQHNDVPIREGPWPNCEDGAGSTRSVYQRWLPAVLGAPAGIHPRM